MFGQRSKRYDSCNWGATNGYTDAFQEKDDDRLIAT
jgi:hypothetical protein